MAGRKIELELPEELYRELEHVAGHLGISQPADAALYAIGQWVAERKAELDNRDPSQRYFVNEALDELVANQRKVKGD